ncbi:MAG: hypothetical protein JAZ18_03525 [Candidatus Thiodiazotropha endolucinida]|nr:hypothetical protein [Candidatus Thiodiazotropha endolucinida]
MFNFFEKNLEKRLLCNHLLSVGLELSEMPPGLARQLLQIVHQQVISVSRKYKQPVHIVSESIICSAAWGIAYCLLGPSKLLDVYPEFKDRTEETEMELLLFQGGNSSENNIYQQIFRLLLDTPYCHPEVKTLCEQTRLASGKRIPGVFDNSFMSLH